MRRRYDSLADLVLSLVVKLVTQETAGTKLYFPQSTFDRRKRSNLPRTVDSRDSRVFDERSSYNSPADTGPAPYRNRNTTDQTK